MEIVAWVAGVIVLLAVLLALWRFLTLRSRGQTVLLRRLPASGLHGWRHGTLRYDGDELLYYKLRSLSPRADHVFHRQQLEFLDSRDVSRDEGGFMSRDLRIATLAEDNDVRYEFALDQHGLMALTAWMESAPDIRHERIDHAALRNRITRGKNGK
ncbi:MAG TPA: DUF2550 domain-containing protein [Corynebacterium sp.]|nr:DUF2550 domain-containing protein [Corynebacterium sp.]